MAKKTNDDQLSDKDAEARANDAMRRALATPYKPQSDIKIGAKKKRRRAQKLKSTG